MVHSVAPKSGITHAQQVATLSNRFQAADLWNMMNEVEEGHENMKSENN
jgi:hypothetical protein